MITISEHLLKTLFIVSDVKIGTALSPSDAALPWSFTTEVPNYRKSKYRDCCRSNTNLPSFPLEGSKLILRVRPAIRQKCPRCWTYTRLAEETVCRRCSDVLSKLWFMSTGIRGFSFYWDTSSTLWRQFDQVAIPKTGAVTKRMYHMFKMYLGDRNKCVANDQNISSLILEKEQYQIEIEIMTAQRSARGP